MKKEKFNYSIYKAENILNGQVYIGATTCSVEQRKLDHVERANRGEANKFHKAIGTYGADAFEWEQIDTASSTDELAIKEKQYIIEYKAKDNGYNADAGGGIQKTVYQYSIEDGNLVNSYDCLESAANAVSASKTSISNVCLGQNKSCMGYIWSYSSTFPIRFKDERKKKVIQLDLQDNFITKYNSVAEASRQSGISKTCISRVCRGERKDSGGFKWKYE